MRLSKLVANGQRHEVSEETYRHFLEAIPPVAMNFDWRGERWNFGFAEGEELVVAFKKEGDRYFAQKTDILNPQECGISIAEQAEGKADGMKRRLEAAREKSRRSVDGSGFSR